MDMRERPSSKGESRHPFEKRRNVMHITLRFDLPLSIYDFDPVLCDLPT